MIAFSERKRHSSYAPTAAKKVYAFLACLRSPVADTILFIQPLDTSQGVVAPTPPHKSVVSVDHRTNKATADSDLLHPLVLGVPRMFGLGVAEILVVCVIGLLLFGNRLPSLARWLGRSFMEFRKEVRSLEEDIRLKG
ncbi:MAG TPA: twin-arginine translocase TatA/TatE family subunit [Gemmataceae bacterium]|jgi:TatA/E family protein of Tat protein translocase